jgi:hypothetical protein
MSNSVINREQNKDLAIRMTGSKKVLHAERSTIVAEQAVVGEYQ